MVATMECVDRPKPTPRNKVSKPLMEKKRRARINQCLDELKSLLESYYSSSIRKRKLEKADILELTVKHLRNLQKIQSCTPAASSECPDYQIGFHSCLANFNQYLLMADNLNGSERWVLSQLTNKLCRSRRRGAVSTTDSGLQSGLQAHTQHTARKLLPSAAGPEGGNTATSGALQPDCARAASFPQGRGAFQSPDNKLYISAAPTQNADGQDSSHKNFVSHGNEAANTQHSVWRPW
ncbi:hairy-related 3 [Cololabis saira]|uniref:hairy-related 3 n=1 Tax=Cololabis saira TaxID=129043 RepID=UPI002AD4C9BE|nr:hairy-related 3 [Cololabis saira]